jgi:hypothetical protein
MRSLYVAALSACLLVGCSDDDDDGGGGGDQTSLAGIVATSDGSTTGSLAVTVESSSLFGIRAASGGDALASVRAPVSASGTVILFGVSTDLSGTWDDESGELLLEGGGYTFVGFYDGATISGTWTGPGGTSGTFIAVEGDDAAAYCGFWQESGGELGGPFSFTVAGGSAYGVASVPGLFTIPLAGDYIDGIVTFDVPGTSTPWASGSIASNGTTTGTFTIPPEFTGEAIGGNWSGSSAACSQTI